MFWVAVLLLFFPIQVFAVINLNEVNQKVTARFDTDTAKLAAVMEEVKRRQGITETRVAYGNVNTPIEQADYLVNFAAEAISFQKVQNYTSQDRLKSDLAVLKNKILRAKTQVSKVIND